MIIEGDALDVLKTLEDHSVDSLITDPPAGIGFMGKEWDKSKGGRDPWTAWMKGIMTECLRVMKPGAHGLVWALPRTSHWTATALEDAGFEIRDVITHLFGSGFPKSLDISKAIDKAAGAEREVIGVSSNDRPKSQIKGGKAFDRSLDKGQGHQVLTLTAPATEAAKQWEGWGTALKPSFEAWLLIAKPFTTVPLDVILDDINNVLRDLVCQQLPVKYVAQVSMSNLRDFDGRQFGFAQWLVDVFHIVKSEEQKPERDILISPEVGSISLSIVSLWKSTLDVLLKHRNTFTTSMESSLITELKILRYSISQITRENTIQEDSQISTQKLNAILVKNLLVSGLLRLEGLLETFVHDYVSTPADGLEPDQKEKLLRDAATIKGVLSEHWILIRKPLAEDTVAANVVKHGCGGINIDGCRVSISAEDNSGWSNSKSWNVNSTFTQAGTCTSRDKPSGRFPANLVLSHNEDCELVGSKEVKTGTTNSRGVTGMFGLGQQEKKTNPWVNEDGTETVEAWKCSEGCPIRLLDEQSGYSKSVQNKKSDNRKVVKSRTVLGDGQIPGEHRPDNSYEDSGGASRFFYVAKASKSDRGEGNNHPTVKSTKLMEYLVKLITPPNGKVLDPFFGSGSTGMAAQRLGFEFIGIEKQTEYVEIARKRIYGFS